MTDKIYVVTDLGPGDGGKGGVVHKISHMMRAHTIIKVGGAQGSHGVCTSSGERFAFSQWGCGTFDGVRTHISSRMVVSPEGLLNEADALRYGCGIQDPFGLLTVDEGALCATPYHGITSRLKEMARGNSPRGTIGTGVGEAYRDAARYPELAIYVRDLSRPDLHDLVAAVQEQQARDLAGIINMDFLPSDRAAAKEEIDRLYDTGFTNYIVARFREAARRAKIVDHDYLRREVFSRDGVVVVESSHGVLTDHFHGFHPHTSAIRTLPCFTRVMLRDTGYNGQIVNVGVHRAYQIRHGAGPMPTDDPLVVEHLLPGSHKADNRYQGKVRVGPLDLELLRYAVAVCGGPSAFDGLAITWFDQIQANGAWRVCRHYRNTSGPPFFSPSGAINVRRGAGAEQLEYQEALGRQLKNCLPEIETHAVPLDAEREDLYSLCAGVLQAELEIPVRLVSFGPTERDKMCK